MPETPAQQPPSDEDALLATLEKHLANTVPTKLLAPINRAPLAGSFVEMLGRLVEFLEKFKPLDHGQMAALLFFVDGLKLDHVGQDAAYVMMKMVDAAKKWARDTRRQGAS